MIQHSFSNLILNLSWLQMNFFFIKKKKHLSVYHDLVLIYINIYLKKILKKKIEVYAVSV